MPAAACPPGGGLGVDRHRAIPACVRQPVADEPSDPAGPVGVLAEEPTRGPGFAACFDPDFPPPLEVQEALERAMLAAAAVGGERMLDRFNQRSRWPGSTHAPISLSWSFVPDGTVIPGGSGIGDPTSPSELFARMDEKFGGIANRAVWIAQFESMFARWSSLVGVTYTRITFSGNPWDDGADWGSDFLTGRRGHVRIGMHPIDGSLGILAYNGYPSGGDMVLDSAENWGNPSNGYRYLRNTLAHEHGHGLGLAHVCPRNTTKLMEPFLTTVFDGPQQDDIRGLQNYYGDPFEPNGSANTTSATPLGVLSPGATFNPSTPPAPAIVNATRTSIGVSGDLDHYRFSVSAPLVATITASPVGSVYADYAQDSACSTSTPNTDALGIGNLALALLRSDGGVIRSESSLGFGVPETINSYLLSPGSDYYIRVSASNSPTEPQLYSLTIAGVSQPFSASDGTFEDRVRITWGLIPAATTYSVYRAATNNRAAATRIAQLGTGVTQFDDTTAAFGATHFYWLEAITNGISGQRPAAGPETGYRAAAPFCDGDFNRSGAVTLDDVFDFLFAYFTGAPAADVNGSGQVTVQDVFDYLTSYFAAC